MNAIDSVEEKGSENIGEYKMHLLDGFNSTFRPKNIEEMKKVLKALQQNENILIWDDIESFCGLFLSFHLRGIRPFNVLRLLEKHHFPLPLLEFLEICTFLESHTDQFAYLEKIEDLKYKEEIIEHLEKLLKKLPTQEQFADLVEAIR